MTYAEYLKSLGAAEEDIKILDNAIGRKAFDKLQADAASAAAEAKDAQARFKTETDAWYNEQILPNYTKMEREAAAAKANEARAIALVKASTDEGLRKVATDMGYGDVVAPPAAAAGAPPAFDASKYMSRDELAGLMDRAGEGLAALEDMVAEHRDLYPNSPRLNVRELRKEAVAAKMTAYDFWEKKYKVPEARAAADTARQEARDNAIRKETEDKVRSELASQYGNPNTSPVAPSINPFAARPSDSSRAKQPWEDGDRTNLRVERVMKVLGSQQTKAN